MAGTATTLTKTLDRLRLDEGLRTAVAAALSYWLTGVMQLSDGYWAAISAIVVMQSQVGTTLLASRDRLLGTAIGGVVGWLTILVWHRQTVEFALAVLVVMVLCSALRLENAGRLGGITVIIIVLIPFPGPVWHVAVVRFLEVLLGVAVSLAVSVAWNQINGWIRDRFNASQPNRIDD